MHIKSKYSVSNTGKVISGDAYENKPFEKAIVTLYKKRVKLTNPETKHHASMGNAAFAILMRNCNLNGDVLTGSLVYGFDELNRKAPWVVSTDSLEYKEYMEKKEVLDAEMIPVKDLVIGGIYRSVYHSHIHSVFHSHILDVIYLGDRKSMMSYLYKPVVDKDRDGLYIDRRSYNMEAFAHKETGKIYTSNYYWIDIEPKFHIGMQEDISMHDHHFPKRAFAVKGIANDELEMENFFVPYREGFIQIRKDRAYVMDGVMKFFARWILSLIGFGYFEAERQKYMYVELKPEGSIPIYHAEMIDAKDIDESLMPKKYRRILKGLSLLRLKDVYTLKMN